MNRLEYIVRAKTQYDIQSPFVYDLYENVLSPRLDEATLSRLGLSRSDRFGQLCYKLADHYGAESATASGALSSADAVLANADGLIGLVRSPHRNREREQLWERLFKEHEVTLSVDMFDTGLVFTSKRLSKQHVVFRIF
ncbi:MAG: hypothetical protein J6031_06585 [Bacteroidales bacterium]|nr:hypothetical protein [Bacteroidales bacterium]